MSTTISVGTTSGTAFNVTPDTSGNLVFQTQAGANTISVPNVTGTIVVSGQNSAITAATAQASTSGTSIDFTGIPSWVKRVTLMFNGVSTNGSSKVLVQIGSGSVTTSGYLSTSCNLSVGGTGTQSTSGFIAYAGNATNTLFGHYVFTLINSNNWVCSHVLTTYSNNTTITGSGSGSLSGALDRVRVTTEGGTDAFDAGTINILYE